jgi:lysophospholipase L1-like esterase
MGIQHGVRTAAVLALVLAGLACAGGEAQAQLKIMPLGDSIKDGYTVPGSYRINLWSYFQAIGLDAFFVGSQCNGPPELGSKKHEGHSGARIDEIAGSVDDWLDASPPDIILLHIGTNDCVQNYHLRSVRNRLSALIDRITDRLPNSVLVVALITPVEDPLVNLKVVRYNRIIPDLIAEKLKEGRQVVLVDMYDAGVTLSDGVHPDRAGYDTMADVWFEALLDLLGG